MSCTSVSVRASRTSRVASAERRVVSSSAEGRLLVVAASVRVGSSVGAIGESGERSGVVQSLTARLAIFLDTVLDRRARDSRAVAVVLGVVASVRVGRVVAC